MKTKITFYLAVMCWFIIALVTLSPAGEISLAQEPPTEEAFDCTRPFRYFETTGSLKFVAVGDMTLSGPDWKEKESSTFCLHAGNRGLTCSDPVPSMLIIQLQKEHTEGVVNANGAIIEFTSTIGLITDSESQMYLLLLDGSAQADDLSVQKGFLVQRLLDQDRCRPLGPWTGNRPFPEESVQLVENVSALLEMSLEDWSPITPSSAEEFLTPSPIYTATSTYTATPCYKRTDWPIHYIQMGDTLSNIAQRVGSTVEILAQANCLPDPNNIIVDQPLYVPRLPEPLPTPTWPAIVLPTPVPTCNPNTRYPPGRLPDCTFE